MALHHDVTPTASTRDAFGDRRAQWAELEAETAAECPFQQINDRRARREDPEALRLARSL